MARLIVKSPYIKCGGGNSAGGYMSVAMIPNEPHPNPDAAHSGGNASPYVTSKFASQNKESLPAIDNFLKIVVSWGWLFSRGCGIVCR